MLLHMALSEFCSRRLFGVMAQLAHGGMRILPGREAAQVQVRGQQRTSDRVPEGRHRAGRGHCRAQAAARSTAPSTRPALACRRRPATESAAGRRWGRASWRKPSSMPKAPNMMSGKTVTVIRALRSCLFSEAASVSASVTGGGVMGCLGSSDHRWSVGEDTRGADSPRSETSASQFAVRTHLRFEY